MHPKIFPILIFFAFAATVVAADAQTPPSVSVADLVTQALTDNPELNFYRAEIGAAKGERRTAGAWSNPEFSAEIGRKRASGEGLSGEGMAWAVSASQTFEWPGRVSLRKAIANQQVALAEVGLGQFKAALAAQVRQKAYALFTAQQRQTASREIANRGEELVATLVQREPAGVAPLLETRAIEGSVIKLKREAAEAAKEMKSAQLELNQLRGRPIGESVAIAEPKLVFADLPPVTELIRTAATGNFELKQHELELAQQGFKVRLSKNEAWPSIAVGPQFSREKATETEQTAGVAVSVALPLWNRNKGNIDAARSRLVQAQISLQVAQREVERKIREQASAYEVNRKEIDRWNPKIVEQLREAADLADRHYRLGAVSLSTYLSVQESYIDALQAIYATYADALHAQAELQLLTGGKIEP